MISTMRSLSATVSALGPQPSAFPGSVHVDASLRSTEGGTMSSQNVSSQGLMSSTGTSPRLTM